MPYYQPLGVKLEQLLRVVKIPQFVAIFRGAFAVQQRNAFRQRDLARFQVREIMVCGGIERIVFHTSLADFGRQPAPLSPQFVDLLNVHVHLAVQAQQFVQLVGYR